MGMILLTGTILLTVSLMTIKKFRTETPLQSAFHVSALSVGVILIVLAIIGMVGYGQEILNY